jgi:transcriptional regulator with XRE-family HTH domain
LVVDGFGPAERAPVRRQDPDVVIRAIGRRIAEVRRERGLTQEAFSEVVGVSEKYVQRVESGANLSIRSLVRFANALDVPIAALVVTQRKQRL